MTTIMPTSGFLFSLPDVTTSVPWIPESVMWLLIVGFIVGFILSFAVGANDVANSFGTTVGAQVISLRQACILATIFETAGAILIGAKVGETIRKGIIDVAVYEFEEGAKVLMMGEVAAMFGSGVWQIIATFCKVPVSGTHSIVGACIGFSLVAVGPNGVNWPNLGFIVASWFVSPVLSGFTAVCLYYAVRRFIVEARDPLKSGLLMLPAFYAVAVGINVFSVLYSGAPLLGFNNLPVYGIFLIALGAMMCVALAIRLIAVPRVKKRGEKQMRAHLKDSNNIESSPSTSESGKKSSVNSKLEENYHYSIELKKVTFGECPSASSSKETSSPELKKSKRDESSEAQEECEVRNELSPFVVQLTSSESEECLDTFAIEDNEKDVPIKSKKGEPNEKLKSNEKETNKDEEVDSVIVHELFSSLQVLTACFASFAHGGNDVSNAIGPLIALWIIFWSGEVVQEAFTPWYLLLYGGFGITIGLWLFGRRVMETIGNDITKVTPSRGFCIELMTAATVLIASNIGIPVSTTHCKVGAVVSIGWFRSRSAVEWSVVRNIAFAWFVTVPVSGLISAGAMYLLLKCL